MACVTKGYEPGSVGDHSTKPPWAGADDTPQQWEIESRLLDGDSLTAWLAAYWEGHWRGYW